jgi:hypothetical protein
LNVAIKKGNGGQIDRLSLWTGKRAVAAFDEARRNVSNWSACVGADGDILGATNEAGTYAKRNA